MMSLPKAVQPLSGEPNDWKAPTVNQILKFEEMQPLLSLNATPSKCLASDPHPIETAIHLCPFSYQIITWTLWFPVDAIAAF